MRSVACVECVSVRAEEDIGLLCRTMDVVCERDTASDTDFRCACAALGMIWRKGICIQSLQEAGDNKASFRIHVSIQPRGLPQVENENRREH